MTAVQAFDLEQGNQEARQGAGGHPERRSSSDLERVMRPEVDPGDSDGEREREVKRTEPTSASQRDGHGESGAGFTNSAHLLSVAGAKLSSVDVAAGYQP